jgi:hypothetical protein
MFPQKKEAGRSVSKPPSISSPDPALSGDWARSAARPYASKSLFSESRPFKANEKTPDIGGRRVPERERVYDS